MTKEHPIRFSGAMVRAILDDRKTQTRQIMKPQPTPGLDGWDWSWPIPGKNVTPGTFDRWRADAKNPLSPRYCPYGKPGDRLWVRETHRAVYPQDPTYNGGEPIEYDYRATYKPGDRLCDPTRWTPSIHMPRAACRLVLEVTRVRVERLNDCSFEDALAEGIPDYRQMLTEQCTHGESADACARRLRWPQRQYALLWDEINGAGAWEANPWVWVVEFRRVQP
ncbi:hypothetical protein RA280_14760 [Cupriavidus sp. CV2]|uniref:hypothetical protein n=1 Tax=Cupriavidus ulmosensis TaxID=3065913 RepID=UPI00296AEDA5|nr:hypothetical protein [Cupriavidus sp. CV2]MDW3682986.1 hypothetical protein [Cupriavidus sp. CV2]